MESLPRSLNYELPHDLHFDKNASPNVLETNTNNIVSATNIVNLASTPTITTLDSITANEFLQKLGASLLNSIQLQNFQNSRSIAVAASTSSSSLALPATMDFDLAANHISFNSSSANYDPFDELQKQLEYDKLMNEVWIGIVFTLILISVVFCICSCFLYHQFRAWKRSYHSTVAQANDLEAAKYNTDIDDPVPEYTLVSGLPSYEAALEIMKKSQKPCLLVYPSVYNLFTQNEKQTVSEDTNQSNPTQSQPNDPASECTAPLLNNNSPTSDTSEKLYIQLDIPSYEEATKVSSTPTTAPLTGKTFNLENKDKSSAPSPGTPNPPSPPVSQVVSQKSFKSNKKS